MVLRQILLILILGSSLAAHARYSETVDEKQDGQAHCQDLLYHLTGRNPALDRIREMLVEDFSDGVAGFYDLAVSSVQVTRSDAAIVHLLSHELDREIGEAARDYANAAMMLTNAYGAPGKLTPAIRLQAARGQVYTAPWLSPAKVEEIMLKLQALAGV